MTQETRNILTLMHRDILAAGIMLIRIPIYWPYDDAPPNIAKSYWAFPLIGVGITAIPAIIAVAFLMLGFPLLATIALMILAITLMTGSLHQDGLADLGDSFAGLTPKDRLRIMHDSMIGSYGTLTLVMIILIEISCLTTIATQNPQLMAQSMIGVAAMSRGMMGLQRILHTPPNAESLADKTGTPDRSVVLIGLLVAFLCGIIFLPLLLAIVAMLTGLAVTYGLGRFLKKWLGGVGGDGLGATQQLSEASMLLIMTVLI